MALAPGTRLGPYEVAVQIGVGGMGEVYRATDTNLKRAVALKVLPDAVATDTERLARFQREAEVLASLNHPNIAAIYGLERADPPSPGSGGPSGTTALVLELVEGPTLADVIAQGPIPVDEALAIAKQIAAALEAAHEAGVIHRDLKPANIKIQGAWGTPTRGKTATSGVHARPRVTDGTVKVLDFGLAKALGPAPSSAAGGLSQSPTITTPAQTMQGVVLGTAAYMSPEQARGQPLDRRTDVWSFGAVLYEMLTGQRAFAGRDVSDTLANVLKVEPNWGALPAGLSPTLVVYLRRCLHKDATERVHDIADVRLALEGAFEVAGAEVGSIDGTISRDAMRASRVRQWATGLVVGSLAVAVAGWALGIPSSGDAPTRALRRFPLVIPSSQNMVAAQGGLVALSPDGQTLVYRALEDGAWRLYVRTLDQMASTPLAGTDGVGPEPFFSPDGRWLGFWLGTSLMKVQLSGGRPVQIAEIAADTRGASWGPDDMIFVAARSEGLLRVPASGGDVATIAMPDVGREYWYPHVLPNGGAVLFTAASGLARDVADVLVLELDTGATRTLIPGGSAGWYAPTGHLVFVRQGDLWAVAFDLGRLAVRGEPAPVEQGIRVEIGGAVQFAAAIDGSLAYLPSSDAAARVLVWVDRQGRQERLPAPPRAYAHPRISPDGTRVALALSDEEQDIWTWNLPNGPLTRVTFGGDRAVSPVWSPDGRQIAFSEGVEDGPSNLFLLTADGTAAPTRLLDSPNYQSPHSFSPDGQYLVFREGQLGSEDLWVLNLDGEPSPARMIATGGTELNAEISPNGRWIAYQSDSSGQDEIYLRPFPDTEGGLRQVSTSGGAWPVWSPDGRTLFYMNGPVLTSAPVDPDRALSSRIPEVVIDEVVFDPGGLLQSRNFDLAPDGQRFLTVQLSQSPNDNPDLVVVQNWFQELTRLVPTE